MTPYRAQEIDLNAAIDLADEIHLKPYPYRVLIHLIFCRERGIRPTMNYIQRTTRMGDKKARFCLRELQARNILQIIKVPISEYRSRNFYSLQPLQDWK